MQSTNPIITGSVKKDGKTIKLPILIPLFASILLLLITFTLAIYQIQQQYITNNVRMRLDSTRQCFNQLLAADANTLDASTRLIENDPNIQNAWLARDRNKLLGITAPLLEKFRQDYRVTHLYFIDTDRTCFLRVHNPPRFGDRIDRFTLDSATKTGKSAWGIELGQYGTFTLRMVHPWFINDTFIGFIELGEEIEHITPQLKEALNIDLVFLIDKSFLSREMWEEGLKIMGRNGNWNLLTHCVIADSTISDLPPEFTKFAGLSHDRHKDHILSAEPNGSTYRAGFVQLHDTAGRDVGDILVVKNVSADQASLRELLTVIAALCSFVGILLFLFFYARIAGIEKHLVEARRHLETEIEKRKQTESELRKHKDNLENTVKERTGELEQTNKYLQKEIVERQKAENALRKSEERFKQVAESAGDWIWEVNAEGLYTYSSPVSEKLLGYKPEEIVGKKCFYDFFAPEIKEEFKKAAFETFNKKESFSSFINPNIHKNGNTVIFETTGIPILDNEGNLCGYRGADRDITERKRTEEILQRERDFSQAVLDSLPGLFYMFDDQGRFLRLNKNFEKVSGYSADELSRMTPLDLFGETDKRNLADAIQQVFQTGEATAEADFLSKDQTKIPYFFTGKLFQFDQKSCLIGMGIDITDRKRAQQRQTQLLEQLESTIIQLNQSNKELKEFAHLAAHDLKTPLRGIGTLAQWLFDDYYGKFDDNGRHKIALLVRRVGRMDKLMDAILQYSTIARNRKNEHPADLNILFRAVLAEIKPPPNIKITTNKDLPIVICEEGHIYQVFYQLLTNGVRFMNKTDGRITIDYADEDKFWRFSISDNGPGIEQQHFERIFRLFQTLGNRDETENTGVGLTLVKKIVELYGGRIWLVSQPGQGTTFNFTMPKQQASINLQIPQSAAT